MKRHLRIGFDARLAGPAHAGIGRYGEELLRRLLMVENIGGQAIDWMVWVNPNHGMPWLSELAASGRLNLRFTETPHYGLLEQTSWVWELSRAQLDLLHVPHFNVPLAYRGRFVATIHDLLWHAQRDSRATTLPPLWHRLKYRGYRLVSESAIKRAAAVLVPSRVVQQEIERLTGRMNNVTVTYEGIPNAYRQAKITASRRERRLVYTGSLYPHKNIEVVLKALINLPGWRLMVASTRSVFTERFQTRARALGVEKQVEWLGYVPDEELIGLYRRARALIQPSKSEGFGLTGLEAMAVGCPVIAADIPIFHEVYANHAQFFAPDDASQLVKLIKNEALNPEQLLAAQRHAESFSWQRTAESTLAVYNSVLASPTKS